MHRLSLVLFAIALLGVSAPEKAGAQVSFTFDVTANSSAFGYQLGQTYSFQFLTGPSFANNSRSFFESYQNMWTEETLNDDQMFISVGGSGLSGTYIRPSATFTDPYCYIETYLDYIVWGSGKDGVFIGAAAEVSDIGLLTSTGESIKSIKIRMDDAGVGFSYPETWVEPATVFFPSNGTYVPDSVNQLTLNTVSAGSLVFTVDSWTINAVPEPSTFALLGLGAAGALVLRRKDRA